MLVHWTQVLQIIISVLKNYVKHEKNKKILPLASIKQRQVPIQKLFHLKSTCGRNQIYVVNQNIFCWCRIRFWEQPNYHPCFWMHVCMWYINLLPDNYFKEHVAWTFGKAILFWILKSKTWIRVNWGFYKCKL